MRHGVDHSKRLHIPSKLLRRRLPSFSGPSDDDDGDPNNGRLQCTPLGVVLKLDRCEKILGRMRARDDLRSRDPTLPVLQQMNADITRTTNEHRRNTWRQFVETLDHKTDPSKLWRTIKATDGKLSPKAENETITFDDTQVSSPYQIANILTDSSPH